MTGQDPIMDMFMVECSCGEYLFDGFEILEGRKRCRLCNAKLKKWRQFRRMAKKITNEHGLHFDLDVNQMSRRQYRKCF